VPNIDGMYRCGDDPFRGRLSGLRTEGRVGISLVPEQAGVYSSFG
jgi:hypothetical protein